MERDHRAPLATIANNPDTLEENVHVTHSGTITLKETPLRTANHRITITQRGITHLEQIEPPDPRTRETGHGIDGGTDKLTVSSPLPIAIDEGFTKIAHNETNDKKNILNDEILAGIDEYTVTKLDSCGFNILNIIFNIDNRQGLALIDTGSSITCAHPDFITKIRRESKVSLHAVIFSSPINDLMRFGVTRNIN